uniref:Uncharacterized protein n=1 Tax=Cucumis melo TaxID=3656 RepID=A0A9I9E368_CUCME
MVAADESWSGEIPTTETKRYHHRERETERLDGDDEC